MKVVSSFLPPSFLQERVKKNFPNVEFRFFKKISYAENDLLDAEILLTFGEDLTEEHLATAAKLKWIMVMSAGVDKMPLEGCREKGIIVTNIRGVHKTPMAEYTIGMMLQYVKKSKALWLNEQAENWDRKIGMGELKGKTILILGVGAIGGEIARLAKAFGMHTMGVNRSGQSVEFVDQLYPMDAVLGIISNADFVVSVLPSTKETVHLLKEEHFRLMKDSAVFINIGRGDLVDEQVLLSALRNKEIAHAFLDVFATEPLPKGHPFWKMENVTVTPHISSITGGYMPRAFELFEQNLDTYINKQNHFVNLIDFSKGY